MSFVKNKWSRVLAMVLAVVMAVMAMPMSAFAAVASDLPEEMVNHSILRALAYTRYDVEQQIADGTLYQSGNYGSRTPSNILSGINYGTSTSGIYHYFEIRNDGETITVENKAGVGFTNKPIVGELELTKTDIADGKPLAGVGFRIKDANGNTVIEGYPQN